MHFVAPQWLAVAALVVPVLLLHMHRARSQTVPSLRLWNSIAVNAVRRHTLRWPRPSVPLLLQLFAVLVVAVALAEPSFSDGPTHRIFIIDATGHGDEAERAAQLDAERAALQQSLVAAPAGSSDRVSVLVGGAVPHVVGARLDDTSALAGPLARVTAQDGSIDAARTADLVHEVSAGGETTSAVLLTANGADSADSATLAQLLAPVDLKIQRLGPAAAPEASLSIAVTPDDGGKWRVRGSAQLSPATSGVTLRALFMPDDATAFLDWADQPLTAGSDGSAEVGLELALPSGGALVVQLRDGDRVAASQRYVLEAREPRVLVVGKSTGALIDALEAIPHLKLFAAETLPADDATFDLVIVNGVTVVRQPSTNTLWVGEGRLANSAAPTGFAAAPTRWDTGSALSQGVDWSSLVATRAYAFPALAGADAVAAQGEGALLEARTLRSGRDVRLAMDIDSSNWPNRADLPVLLHNIIAWSGLQTRGAQANACVVGQACPLPPRLLGGNIAAVPEQVGRPATDEPAIAALPAALIHDPEGWIDAGGDGAFVPERAGLYRLTSGDRSAWLAVNPAPRAAPGPGAAQPPPISEPAWQPAVWWVLLVVGALLILAELGATGWLFERFLRPEALSRNDRRHIRHRVIGIVGALAGVALLAGVAAVPLLLPKAVARIVISNTAPTASDDAGRVATDGSPRVAADLGGTPVLPAASRAPGSLADVLQLATAMAGGRPARLMVDGTGQPDWLAALPGLQTAALPVDVKAAPTPAGDVVVEQVEGPARAYAADGLTLHAVVYSPGATPATVTVSNDGNVVDSRNVQLQSGDNRLDLPVGNVSSGDPLYEVRVEAAGDPIAANNRNAIRIAVGPPLRVGIIASHAGAATALSAALSLQGLQPTVIAGNQAPTSLASWLAYDVIALMDLPASSLTRAQQSQLESAVRDHGRGLLLLGGESSFGPGGYDQTALGEMSPVSSRTPQDAPRTGLVFVLDRSGSMQLDEGGVSRLTIAKAAAIKAIRLLNPGSMVGVVAFDTLAMPVVALQQVDDMTAIQQSLTLLEPGGGTSVYPGLDMAYKMLRDVPYPSRHIILISDGQSQAGDFASLEQQITNSGITVSAIAIGADADPGILADIADKGNGIFHWSRDFHALPSLLSQETLMATTSPIKRGPIQPTQAEKPADFLQAVTPPAIDGYVETSLKNRAQLDWSVRNDRGQAVPVLAHWQFGQGQVLALTTQAAGDWVTKWLSSPAYPRFWSAVARAFAPAPADPGESLELRRDGDAVMVSAEAAPEADPALSTQIANITLAGETAPRQVILSRQSDGSYQGRFAAGRPGDYSVTLDTGTTASIHVAYSANYGAPRPGNDPAALTSATGGTLLVAGEAVPSAGTYWSAAPDWRIWTCVGLLLFMSGLVLRYLPMRFRAARRSNNREGTVGATPVASTPATGLAERRTAA